MTEWREVPEINESHIGWTVAYGKERYTIAIKYDHLFQTDKGDRLDTKGPWLVKPPEKEDRCDCAKKMMNHYLVEPKCPKDREKPKPEPYAFWWGRNLNGGEWLLSTNLTTEPSPINGMEYRPAKPDKDGKFYPPEQ